MTDAMPDLSHLTDEERQIIERVLQRQRQEESQEQQLKQKYEKQLEDVEKQIEERKEIARKLVGTMDDAICQICQKTKFADGIGHKCYYCQLRSCARCGGRLQIKAKVDKTSTGPAIGGDRSPGGSITQQKTIWSCSLCQQRQQILAKTGKWFHQGVTVTGEQAKMSPDDQVSLDDGKEAEARVNSELEDKRPAAPLQERRVNENGVGTAKREARVCLVQKERASPSKMTIKRQEPIDTERRESTASTFSPDTMPYGRVDNDKAPATEVPKGEQSGRRIEERLTVKKYPETQMARKETVHTARQQRVTPIDLEWHGDTSQLPPTTDGVKSDATNALLPQVRRSSPASTRKTKQSRKGVAADVSKSRPRHGSVPRDSEQTRYEPSARASVQPTLAAAAKRVSSISSSDEDFPSTSEGQSYEELESEKSCLSDRIASARRAAVLRASHSASAADIEQTLDLNEPNRPVQWQSSDDGSFIYRNVSLRRHVGTSLGLKVVGGRSTGNGTLGAFVTKVKKGSVADLVGRLMPGDEVLQWNGHILKNASFDEVCNAINTSKFSDRIHLVVARRVERPFLQKHYEQQQQPLIAARGVQTVVLPSSSISLPGLASAIGQPVGQAPIVIAAPLTDVMKMQDVSGAMLASALRTRGQIFGQIQLSLLYMAAGQQLIVNIHEAVDLPPRADGTPRNPYIKMFLLPERSENSRRQSKTMAETCNPVWHQSMIYKDVTEVDLDRKIVEITVWDYDQYSSNEFLGEVLIDLSKVDLHDTPSWYTLIDMDEETALRKKVRQARLPSASYGAMAGLSSGYNVSLDNVARPRSAMERQARAKHPVETRQRLKESRYDDPRRYATVGRCSGYRSDSALAHYPTVNRWESRSPRYNYDSAEETEGRFGDWEPRAATVSGYCSDYGDRHRADYRQGAKTSWSRREQQSLSRRAMLPLELRPNSPTEESGNDTSSPSHAVNMRYLPRAPGSHQATEGRKKHFGIEKPDDRYDDSRQSKTAGGERAARRNLQSRSNATGSTADCLSDDSETSISLTSGRLVEHPSKHSKNSGGAQSECPIVRGEPAYSVNEIGLSEISQPGSSLDSAMAAADKRKRNLMTRLIPGRNNNANLINEQKRTGFRRSDEVGVPANLSPQTSFDFAKQSSRESTDSNESSLVPMVQEHGSMGEFVEGLGPGQVVGRQAIASPCSGEIQLALLEHRRNLEVRVIRAKHLTKRTGSKFYPSPYVKVYLCNEKSVLAKAKTGLAARNPEPRFDQLLIFTEPYQNRLLQVIVIGDYGRMERKSIIGVAIIKLANLDMSKPVEGREPSPYNLRTPVVPQEKKNTPTL